MAQNILAKAKEKLNEIKAERRADVVASNIAKKNAKAEYRKEMVKESSLIAKREAKLDVRAGGKFKRKVAEYKKKKDYDFKSSKKKGKSQGEYARDRMTLGTGKNPFEL